MKKLKKILLTMLLLPVFPVFLVPGEEGETNNDDNSNNENDDSNNNLDDSNNANENVNQNQVTFQSQEEFDKVIQKRINQATNKLRKDFENEKKKSQMSEIDKYKFEVEQAKKEVEDMKYNSNQVLIKADVITIATKMGIVDPDAAYALMDKSNVEINDGKVYGVKQSLDNLVKEKNYLLGNTNNRNDYRVGDDQNSNNKNEKKVDFNKLLRQATGRL